MLIDMIHFPLHRIIAICAVFPLSLVALAQDDLEVTVEVPGTLQEQLLMIEPNARNEVTKLKVNGNIDGNDMMFIRELCGVKNISTPVEGKLTHLDLTDAFITATDKPYISLYGTDFTTQDDIFGCCFLYNCRQLQSVQLPHTILGVDSFALASCASLETLELPVNINYIGYGALVGCDALETLDVPNTVDSIATGAFQKMAGLRELTLGDGVVGIDNSLILGDDSLKVINVGMNFNTYHPVVFYTAPALEEINVTYTNPYLCSEDGVVFSFNKDTLLTFPPASRLSNYQVPEGVRRIGHSAFYGAASLSSISMPETVTTIDSLAFFNCLALQDITLGANTESIAFGAFGVIPESELIHGTSILIPPSVSSIEEGAFFCNNKAVIVDSDNAVYASDENGFLYDKQLTNLCCAPATASFNLPSTVTTIGAYALAGCQQPSLFVNDKITTLGDGAFAYATGLVNLSLGAGLTHLGDMLVQGCKNLQAVYLFTEEFADENVAEYAFLDEEGSVLEQCTLYVKPGLTDYYFMKRGFFSEEYETFFFADIQEMENPDGISPVTGNANGAARYFSVDGKRQRGARSGLNIIRLPEGRSVKRFFK